jgi:Leucine-rich repeat (LRR) protein
LNGQQLRELPQAFVQITTLVDFDASHNQLSALPDEFGELTALRELSLRSNRIQHLPHTFMQCASLQILDLAHNQLYLLPAEMGDLTELRVVDMSHNQLVGLPKSFGALHNLQRCDLSFNEMELLPQIENLTSLESLNLSHNRLWALPDDFGAEMPSLTSLDLSYNSLTWLPWRFFDYLAEARVDLSHNALSSFPLSARRVAWSDNVILQGTTWPGWSLMLGYRALALAGDGCRCRPRVWWPSVGSGNARQPTFAEDAARDGMREALNSIETVEAQVASDEAE